MMRLQRLGMPLPILTTVVSCQFRKPIGPQDTTQAVLADGENFLEITDAIADIIATSSIHSKKCPQRKLAAGQRQPAETR